MKKEYIMTMKEVRKEILSRMEYDGFTNKPYIDDKTFDTLKEAIDYEFKVDDMYDPIRHLSLDDKVVQYWDEDDMMCYKEYKE